MKHFICLLLLLTTILCACTPADTGELTTTQLADTGELTTAQPAPTTAAKEDEFVSTTETTAEGTESVSPVRMKLVYEKIVLTEKYPDLKTSKVFYFYDDTLFVLAQKNAEGIQYIHVFDFSGQRIDMLEVPQVEIGYVQYAYPLHSGKWVIGILQKKGRDPYRQMLITDGQGMIEWQSPKMTDHANADYFVEEQIQEDTCQVHIMVDTVDGYRVFYGNYEQNGNLRDFLIPTHSKSSEMQMFVIGDGNYGVFPACAAGYDRARINVNRGTISEYPLQLPQGYPTDNIYRGKDGNDYIENHSGIFLQRGNEPPELVMNYLESGLKSSHQSSPLFQVYDRHTFANLEVGAGGPVVLYRSEYVPDEDHRQVIEVQFLFPIKNNEWLEESITRFNQQNSDYRVELTCREEVLTDAILYHERAQALLDQILLFEKHPDIILSSQDQPLASHNSKNIYVNLNDLLQTELLGALTECYSTGGALYQIPMMFQLDTLAANTAVASGPMTYENFIRILNSLQPGEALASMMPTSVYQNALMDFVDYETRTTSYHTEQFRDVLRYIRNITYNTDIIDRNAGELIFGLTTAGGDIGRYGVTNGTVSAALESGALKFLNVSFHTPEAFSTLRLLFGDIPYTLCGYPCIDGCGARISSDITCSVMQDSDVAGGCAQFLNFLLSEERQNDAVLLFENLPVTKDAMRQVLENYRYVYYDKATVNALRACNNPRYIDLTASGHSAEYDPQFNGKVNTEEYYTVLETTDEDIDFLMDFFEQCHMRANTDEIIKSIVEEEISFWEGNARSLEETTKIIDSRVWIYLNE